ncbi:hypothetical protein B296_00007837 [Ensete ventricosum]|uniref:Uncharacterized protein n=1 Tax=Ensete ventricosum TaxID=4639 RepID=A0A426ZV46_ENSVE|nr:hypothetical protein B296_00007837 [Ensete ventricosum]
MRYRTTPYGLQFLIGPAPIPDDAVCWVLVVTVLGRSYLRQDDHACVACVGSYVPTGKAPYRPIHTGPIADRYANREYR